METKSTKQTFNGYSNWQTYNLANWALNSVGYSFETLKEEFMIEFEDIPGNLQGS